MLVQVSSHRLSGGYSDFEQARAVSHDHYPIAVRRSVPQSVRRRCRNRNEIARANEQNVCASACVWPGRGWESAFNLLMC